MPAITVETKLTDLFSARSIADYYDTAKEDVRPYLGAALFPSTKTVGLDLKYVTGKANSPVILRQSAFDANAPIRPRWPFKQIVNEMPFFRESMIIGERERQDMLKYMASNEAYAKPVIDRIYNDAYYLVLGADAAVERLRMALLSTGKISFLNNNDGVLDYEYGFDSATQTTTKAGENAWNVPATAKPLQDLQNAKKAAKLGQARAIMTEATYNNMLACEEVKGAAYPPTLIPSYVPHAMITDYISRNLGITFVIIDEESNTYRETLNGEDKKMFPDGVVSLIPATGTLGSTWYGTTPEEADLMAQADVDVRIVNTGVAITSHIKYHPVNIETIVSQIVLPSFEGVERVHIINAYAA